MANILSHSFCFLATPYFIILTSNEASYDKSTYHEKSKICLDLFSHNFIPKLPNNKFTSSACEPIIHQQNAL